MVGASCLGCGSNAGAGSPAAILGRRMPKRLAKRQLEELTSTTKLSEKEVRALYSRFRRLAPTGSLNQEQFRQTMGVLGLTEDTFLPERMFKVFDADQDGQLSFHEFATSLAVMIRGTEDEKLKLSFDMTAGQRGARGISLEDFQRLIVACNTMLSSLLVPSRGVTPKEDIEHLFHELSSDDNCCGGMDGPSGGMISLEAYKAAAQSDENFLQCLGLKANSNAPVLRRMPSGVGARNRTGTGTGSNPVRSNTNNTTAVPLSPSASAPSAAVVPSGHHLVSQVQIERLRERVARVTASLQHAEQSSSCPASSSRCRAPAMEPLERITLTSEEDEEEHWWTPLRLRRPPPLASVSAGPTTLDDVCVELDRIIGLCSSGDHAEPFASSNVPGPSRFGALAAGELLPRTPVKQDVSRDGCVSPHRREISRDGEEQPSGLCKSNVHVHKPAAKVQLDSSRMADEPGSDHERPKVVRSQSLTALAATNRRARKRHRLLGPKKGLAVHFGHENWNMVLSMMIGIRMAIGRSKMEVARDLEPIDFYMKEKFSIIPRISNIFDNTASKRVTVTRFIDYAPMVFQRIRSSFGIQHDDYLRSVGPEQLLGNMVLGNLSSLAELSSEGKSGAFFYYTADGNYMLKTVTRKECVLLRRMLKPYHDHIFQNSGTLLVRFLGMHCLSVKKMRKGPVSCGESMKKLYFVVMANMFNTPFEIHRRYDLKGSWVGRSTPPDKVDPSCALKDVDFQEKNEKIVVGEERKTQICKQLELDSHFLASNNIIDYSLLLGIHDSRACAEKTAGRGDEENRLQDLFNDDRTISAADLTHSPSRRLFLNSSSRLCDLAAPLSPISNGSRAGAGGESENPIHRSIAGGMLSTDQQSLYFLGVIDILTPYDTYKVMEHSLKGIRYDRRGVSCCPPAMYADRFNSFMQEIFC